MEASIILEEVAEKTWQAAVIVQAGVIEGRYPTERYCFDSEENARSMALIEAEMLFDNLKEVYLGKTAA